MILFDRNFQYKQQHKKEPKAILTKKLVIANKIKKILLNGLANLLSFEFLKL